MEKIMLAVMRFLENGLAYLISALMAIELVANLCKATSLAWRSLECSRR